MEGRNRTRTLGEVTKAKKKALSMMMRGEMQTEQAGKERKSLRGKGMQI